MGKNGFRGGAIQKRIREKGGGGGQVKYFSKTLKWHNVLISKKFFRTNIVDRIPIYYRLFFRLKIPLDVVFSPLSLSFI